MLYLDLTKGFGRKLMENAHKWGKEKVLKRVKVFVSCMNTNMIRLCKILGYKESFIQLEKYDFSQHRTWWLATLA